MHIRSSISGVPPLILALALGITGGCDNTEGKAQEGSTPSDDDDDDDGDDDDDDDDADDDDDDDDGDDDDDDAVNNCIPGIGECDEGFKCQPYAKDGDSTVRQSQCVAITGDRQLGETCERTQYDDDCGKDLFCFCGTSGSVGQGICKQLCDGENADSCSDLGLPDALCQPWNEKALPMCERSCHPLRPDCPGDEACFSSINGYICTEPDVPAGGGKDGDDCYTVQSCNPGLTCRIAADLEGCTSDYCCTPFCDLTGDSSQCVAPETCILADETDVETDPALEDVGVCGLSDDG